MTGDHMTKYRGPTRFLLFALGLTQLTIGLWALLGSRSFYNDFPFGQGWVSADGPYNQHLLTDFGALYVATRRAGPFVRYVYRDSRRMTGRVVQPVAVMAHHQLILMGYGALELTLERSDRVPKRLKMLAELKASVMTGCEFCIDIGSKLS